MQFKMVVPLYYSKPMNLAQVTFFTSDQIAQRPLPCNIVCA